MKNGLKRYGVIFNDGLNLVKEPLWYVWARNLKEARKLAKLEAKAKFITCHAGTIDFTVKSVKLATTNEDIE